MKEPKNNDIAEENLKIRKLRLMVDLTISTIYQGNLTRREALEHFEGVKRFALRLFPGKDSVFELIYAHRFKRVIGEIYGPR